MEKVGKALSSGAAIRSDPAGGVDKVKWGRARRGVSEGQLAGGLGLRGQAPAASLAKRQGTIATVRTQKGASGLVQTGGRSPEIAEIERRAASARAGPANGRSRMEMPLRVLVE